MSNYDDLDYQPIINRIPQEWGKYVSIGPGWKDLVVSLDLKLAEIDPEYTIYQVKEKFGGLRYYVGSSVTNKMFDLIAEVESTSLHTCEECGDTATQTTIGGWWVTLCKKHVLEAEENYENKIANSSSTPDSLH